MERKRERKILSATLLYYTPINFFVVYSLIVCDIYICIHLLTQKINSYFSLCDYLALYSDCKNLLMLFAYKL